MIYLLIAAVLVAAVTAVETYDRAVQQYGAEYSAVESAVMGGLVVVALLIGAIVCGALGLYA